MYFEIFKDVSGYIRWRLKAGNNRIIAASEAYTTEQAALDTINAIVQNVGSAKIFRA